MRPRRNSGLIFGLLMGVWALVVVWQVEEHIRVRETAQTSLRRRSEAIAKTIGAVVRGQRFRGAALRENLEPVLKELVGSDTNGVESGEVISIELLGNDSTNVLASAGRPIELPQDIRESGEHWGLHIMTRVYPVEGAFLTNTLIFELSTNDMGFGRSGPSPDRMQLPAASSSGATNVLDTNETAAGRFGPPRAPTDGGGPGFGPPMRGRPPRPAGLRRRFQELEQPVDAVRRLIEQSLGVRDDRGEVEDQHHDRQHALDRHGDDEHRTTNISMHPLRQLHSPLFWKIFPESSI